jgi:predicted anti-sigma-YlaC factor YlaD
MTRLFGCRRFRRLSSEREDRDLSSRESRFFDAHLACCPACRLHDSQAHAALDVLRGAAITEVELTPMFDERVIRRFRAQKVKESIRYWSPALAGAMIACVAIFATLAMVSRPEQMKSANVRSGSADRFQDQNHRAFPNYELSSPPRFNR